MKYESSYRSICEAECCSLHGYLQLQACQHTTAKQRVAKTIAIQGTMLYSLADR
jgi:hypothetical protein